MYCYKKCVVIVNSSLGMTFCYNNFWSCVTHVWCIVLSFILVNSLHIFTYSWSNKPKSFVDTMRSFKMPDHNTKWPRLKETWDLYRTCIMSMFPKSNTIVEFCVLFDHDVYSYPLSCGSTFRLWINNIA